MKALSIGNLWAMTVCCALCVLPMRGDAIEAGVKLAQDAGAQGKTEGAPGSISEYKKALAERPDWTEGWWNLGALEYSANDFGGAKAALVKVVGLAPRMGAAWGLLGLSEFEMKDFSDALGHLERADALGVSEDAEIQRVSAYHLALLLIRGGSFERASGLLQKNFGGGGASGQAGFSMGLAMLRVPLLPDEVDPSKEAMVAAAGRLAAAGEQAVTGFPAFLTAYPEVPYAHYAYGIALERAGRIEDAVAEMQTEARISPASPLPWRAIAGLDARLHKPDVARSAELKAVALESTTAAGREHRLVRLYGSGGSAPLRASAQGDAEVWSRAMREYASGDYGLAIADLKPWLAQHAEDGTAWAVLGLSEYRLQDFASALIHLERGESLGLRGSAESVQTARYTTGILLLRKGDFERATEVLESAAKWSAGDDKITRAMGLCLLRRAELPGDGSATGDELVFSAGKIARLLEESRYDEAFALFRPLVARFPRAPNLHYAYGTALLALSEFDEAAGQMRAEAVISPASELPYVRLASIALRQHKPAEAIPLAGRALALAPQSAEAHYLLGRAALESGDDAVAVRELEIASRLDPGSPEVHFNLARAYSRGKRADAAETERATFARLNELSESEKSRGGSQIYGGPREQNSVTNPAADPQATSPPRP